MILTQDHQDTTQKEEALSRDRNLHQEAPNRERNLEKDGGRITDLHQEPGRPGSRIDLPPEEVGLDAEEEEQEPYFEAEDHVKDEAAALRVTEEQMEGDYLVDKATSSVSASNPWVLNEADVICSRLPDGSLEHNSSGERVINLREWGYLLTEQRVFLRRQDIRKPESEKLPWTGRVCYLFTRAWEVGRWKSHHKKVGEFNEMRTWQERERARARGSDWMIGQVDPQNWERRYEIDKNSWHETWLLYGRDLEIHEDMERLSEAVYQPYQAHLDKMIRKNDKLWVGKDMFGMMPHRDMMSTSSSAQRVMI